MYKFIKLVTSTNIDLMYHGDVDTIGSERFKLLTVIIFLIYMYSVNFTILVISVFHTGEKYQI